MDKIKKAISQRQFIKTLFDSKVPREEAVNKVTVAFNDGTLHRGEESKTQKSNEEMAKKIVSHFYWDFRKDSEKKADSMVCNDNAVQDTIIVPAIEQPTQIDNVVLQKKGFWDI